MQVKVNTTWVTENLLTLPPRERPRSTRNIWEVPSNLGSSKDGSPGTPRTHFTQKNANEPSAKGKHQLPVLLSTEFTGPVNKEYNIFQNNLIRT